jgi:hypothetical protein
VATRGKIFVPALVLLMAADIAFAQQAPSVTIELRAIDPAAASVVPLDRAIHGHIAYTTDAPVRFVLTGYRNGQPVKGTNSGSPTYAPGSGETSAWFSFHEPQWIDEIRAEATATDGWGTVIAHASIMRSIEWRAGAAAPAEAAWVDPLRRAPKDIIERPPQEESFFDWILLSIVQLVFLVVPFSVALQFYAWRKLQGRPKQLARISGYLMAALWLFVIVTAMAGSNLSPIWLVFLSPVFVAYLAMLIRWSRRTAGETIGKTSLP